VTNLAPACAGHAACLANRKRREIVMEHEGLFLFALVALQPLAIVLGAQSSCNQGLRFAAGE
jgi:hypothetical protein